MEIRNLGPAAGRPDPSNPRSGIPGTRRSASGQPGNPESRRGAFGRSGRGGSDRTGGFLGDWIVLPESRHRSQVGAVVQPGAAQDRHDRGARGSGAIGSGGGQPGPGEGARPGQGRSPGHADAGIEPGLIRKRPEPNKPDGIAGCW